MTPKTWGSVRLKPKLAPDADSNKLLGPGVKAATAAKVKKERSVVESTTDDPKNDRSESIAEMSTCEGQVGVTAFQPATPSA